MSSPSGSAQNLRSHFVAGVLVLLLAAAAVGLVFALRGQSDQTRRAHRAQKVAHAVSVMQQLADSVNSHYQDLHGKPLNTLTVQKPELAPGKPLKEIAIVHVATQQPTEMISPAQTVMFSACGASDDCSIPGTISASRRVLVEREALELALKTFSADPATNFVLVKTPMILPGAGRIFIYFKRDELTKEIERPFVKTLPESTVPPDGVMDNFEKKTIDRLVQNLAVSSQTPMAVGAGAVVLVPLGEALAANQQQAASSPNTSGAGTAP